MKSPLTKVTCFSKPAFLVYFVARATWNALLFNPTISASVKRAISRAGPPTPQPTSRTRILGWIPVLAARKCSVRLVFRQRWFLGRREGRGRTVASDGLVEGLALVVAAEVEL